MSETSSLTELARFIGQSRLSAGDGLGRLNHGQSVKPKLRPQRHSVGELLGVVLALSARTRRGIMPRVDIDIDVFSPTGGRAVKIMLPRR